MTVQHLQCWDFLQTLQRYSHGTNGEVLWIFGVTFFTQSSTKIFCSGFFNVGGCLASCLTLDHF